MLQINRANISTTAEGATIVVLTQPGAGFKNFGNLTTSGNLASAIKIGAAGVAVSNYGKLATSGDGSAGIVVGDPFEHHYDNAVISNYGSIRTFGTLVDNGTAFAFANGIDVFGNYARISNYGSITISGDQAGINSIGANSTIINHGKIDTNGIGIVLDQIDGSEIHNTVVNYGQIHTGNVEFSYGIWALVGDNVIKNHGMIQVDGFHAFGIAMEGDRNRGENYGTILATGEQGRGVLLYGEHLSFLNRGTIIVTGDEGVGLRFAGENLPGTDGGTFANYGKVDSVAWAVRGADSDDHVINHGLMAGTVDLGAGNDVFIAGKGGTLEGALVLGDGNDLVIFERGSGELTISDFVAGAGTDDVLDISAFGFNSLDQLLAHALQNGSDALLNLSGHDQITLQNTSLASLAPDDFMFAGSSLFAGIPHTGTAPWLAHPDVFAMG